MSQDEAMRAELERLREENKRLKEGGTKSRDISLKVSQKGALSVYGLGRFPVTLYREQWTRLLERKDEILRFLEDNQDQLKMKE
ncbi:MAG: hypothetical protein ACO3JL_16185 [Myxococcota bacterium]